MLPSHFTRIQHKNTWIFVIKIFAINLPLQPFLGRHLGFHIFFHNGLLGGCTLFLQLGCFKIIFHFFLYAARRSSSPKDKGACNSEKGIIQTWCCNYCNLQSNCIRINTYRACSLNLLCWKHLSYCCSSECWDEIPSIFSSGILYCVS